MKKLWLWLDKNLIKIFFSIFLVLIPLYPKLPLIDIEYTYIYIRFEDFFVGLFYLIFLIQLLRKKVKINWSLFRLFILFWLSVFISFYWGHWQIKTVPVNYIGFLHSFRRIEYMFVFFIGLASTKNQNDFYYYLKIILLTFFIVCFYGIGQKLFGWPAVQTMNPEYARGYFLFLTPEARISSTFSGHYDLASYLIFIIPLIISGYLFFHQKKYFFLFVLGLINLVFTASRISYIGYILTVFPLLIWLRKFRLFFVILFLTIVLTLANNNLTSRLKRTFQVKRILVDQRTGAVYIPQKITTKELPAGSFYIPLKNQNTNSKDLEEYKKKLILEKEIQATKSGQKIDVASLEANLKPVNTVLSDISFATRLQIEWPRAINAFKKSPLFGAGPSSITEATDNDYLRWLGELGLVGTSIFLIILIKIIYKILQAYLNNRNKTVLLGFVFGVFALMINASYIDVFEASKVAFTFWSLLGIFYGYILTFKHEK